MVLHNPNNWHWVNKDASAWTRQWLEEKIKDIKAEENGVSAQLDKVVSMDGDVDVNQRKGKVITIFDVKLVLEYSGMPISSPVCDFLQVRFLLFLPGKTADDNDVSGTITIPEVAHDTEEDEYVVCLLRNLEFFLPRTSKS